MMDRWRSHGHHHDGVVTLAAEQVSEASRAVQKWLLRGQKMGTGGHRRGHSEICNGSVTRRLKMKRLVTCSS